MFELISLKMYNIFKTCNLKKINTLFGHNLVLGSRFQLFCSGCEFEIYLKVKQSNEKKIGKGTRKKL